MGTQRKIVSVVGHAAELHEDRAGRRRSWRGARTAFEHVLVHTGQHYDDGDVARLLRGARRRRSPTTCSTSGSGSHAQQTARVMERLEPVLLEIEPDLVLVPGDVNSTLAAALVASKLEHPGRPHRGRPAQLRPHDARGDQPDRRRRGRPTCCSSTRRRRATTCWREGAPDAGIHYVGNTMIDTLVAMLPRIREPATRRAAHGLERGELPARHAAPPGARRRPAAGRRDRAARRPSRASCRSSSRATRARAPRWRRSGIDAAAGRRPAASSRSATSTSWPRRRRGGRADRLRRHPGGDHLPRRPVLHAARQHRAAGHGRAGHEHAARAWRPSASPSCPR